MSNPPVLLSLIKNLHQLFQHHLKHQFLHLHQGSRTFYSLSKLPQLKVRLFKSSERYGSPSQTDLRQRHKVAIPNFGDTSSQLHEPIPNATIHKFCKTHPRRGYIAKFRVPRLSYPRPVNFSKRDTKGIASSPTSMRILDIGIYYL